MFDIADKIKLFAFDLDGTLYIGDNPVSGAVALVDYLRSKFKIAFFTNNSSKTAKAVQGKLNRLGFECILEEVYTSSFAAARYMKELNIDNLYVIGSEEFRSELEDIGLRIVDNDSAANLVVGLDFDFNYKKIAIALSVLSKGGKFIACNEDPSFPVGQNEYMPGCGAMVGAIAASANKRPDFIVGKPHTYMLSKIAKAYGVKHDEIIVVGDSYESDIMMALNYDSPAIFINPKDNIANENENVLVIDNLNKILTYVREHK